MIGQVELTNGRHTQLPDADNWSNVRAIKIDDVGYKVGEYNGVETVEKYTGEWPLPRERKFRKSVLPGEVIKLLPASGYTAIYRAAQLDDNILLIFLERTRYPTSRDGKIDLTSNFILNGLDRAVSQGYITPSDKAKVLKGAVQLP